MLPAYAVEVRGAWRSDVKRVVVRLVTCVVATWVLVGCGDGTTDQSASPAVAIRTLAYVVTECHDRPEGAFGRQRLEVLRGGSSTPVLIKEIDAFAGFKIPDLPVQWCTNVGLGRLGQFFLASGVMQRLGVAPDGNRIVFEITDAFRVGEVETELPENEKGIFVVGADGSGLRRLAPPSRDPTVQFDGGRFSKIAALFAFSPDGKTVAYTDRGPGPDGVEAVQIVTLDLDTGIRTPITRLPPSPPPRFDPTRPATESPFFVDANRIAFFSTANPDNLNPKQELVPFTVHRDGTQLSRGPQPTTDATSELVPQFIISGPAPSASLLSKPTPARGPQGFPILELFLLDGDNLLQLTDFDREDITDAVVSADGSRVFFNASADPCTDGRYTQCSGSNPHHNCQIFSVDRLGDDLRQLTAFDEGPTEHYEIGCYESTPPRHGCAAAFLSQDPHTGTLVFLSSCDPLHMPTRRGAPSQIYAMRPDGSGLRALTSARGLFSDAQGFDATELPGPFAYSSSSARSLR